MPQEHKLKTWPVYWDAVERGDKNFEVRRDDRGFQRGDILVLERFDPKTQNYVWEDQKPGQNHWEVKPKAIRRQITYVLTGGQLGVESGYVVLGLAELPV